MATAIYIRTSTNEQTPELQLTACHGINPMFLDAEVYQDQQSAWKEHIDRPGFNQLKTDIKLHRIQDLVVWDLDRLFRNRTNLINFFVFCKQYNCKIHSYRQNWLEQIIQMPPPWDEIIHSLMLQIMGWLAEEESTKKSERIRMAMRKDEEGVTRSYKGKIWGRKALSKVAVNKILEMASLGISVREISRRVFYSDSSNNMRPVSKSTVHKVIQDNKPKKVSKEA